VIRREFGLFVAGSALLLGSRTLAAMQDTKEVELRVEGMI